jgi:CheY-like chemotaxis protein
LFLCGGHWSLLSSLRKNVLVKRVYFEKGLFERVLFEMLANGPGSDVCKNGWDHRDIKRMFCISHANPLVRRMNAQAIGNTMTAMNADTPLILVVEDNDDLRELIGFTLLTMGRTAKVVGDLDEALVVLAQHHNICLVLIDLGVQGMMSVEEFIEGVRWLRAPQKVKFILTSSSSHVAAEAERLQADAFLFKPFEISELERTIAMAFKT